MFLSGTDKMIKIYKGPCIDTSCKILFYLAKHFVEEKILYASSNQKKVHDGHIFSPNKTKWGNFTKDLTLMLLNKYLSIWLSGFWGIDISKSETRIVHCGNDFYPIGIKWANIVNDLAYMLPVKCFVIWQSSSEEGFLNVLANQKSRIPLGGH